MTTTTSSIGSTIVIKDGQRTIQIFDADGDGDFGHTEYAMFTDSATGEVRALRGSGEAVEVQSLAQFMYAEDIFFLLEAGGSTTHHDPLILDLNRNGRIDLSAVNNTSVALGASQDYQWGDKSPGAHFRPGNNGVPAVTGTARVYGSGGLLVATQAIDADDQGRLQSQRMGFDGTADWHDLQAGQRVEFYDTSGRLVGELKQVGGGWNYHWNLYGNGALHQWVDQVNGVADGILVVDDPNGVSIRDQVNVRSMISEYDPETGQKVWRNGQERLAATVDEDTNGVVDAAEMNAAHLKVWQDNNVNGVVDDGELTTLDSHGIDFIRVNSYLDDTPNVTSAGAAAATLSNVTYSETQLGDVGNAVGDLLTGGATTAEVDALIAGLRAGTEQAQGVLRGNMQIALGYGEDANRDLVFQFGIGAAGLTAVDVRGPDGSQVTTDSKGDVVDTSDGAPLASTQAVSDVPGQSNLALFTHEGEYLRIGYREVAAGFQGLLTDSGGNVNTTGLTEMTGRATTDRIAAGIFRDAELFYGQTSSSADGGVITDQNEVLTPSSLQLTASSWLPDEQEEEEE